MVAFVSIDIQCRSNAYPAVGQGFCLIRAQHIHAAKIFNGGQSFYNHLLFRHLLGTMCQIDTHNSPE